MAVIYKAKEGRRAILYFGKKTSLEDYLAGSELGESALGVVPEGRFYDLRTFARRAIRLPKSWDLTLVTCCDSVQSILGGGINMRFFI
jgi:hypothetical protein